MGVHCTFFGSDFLRIDQVLPPRKQIVLLIVLSIVEKESELNDNMATMMAMENFYWLADGGRLLLAASASMERNPEIWVLICPYFAVCPLQGGSWTAMGKEFRAQLLSICFNSF